MLRLALNAVSADTGGAISVLLGYLRAWPEIGADLSITVYASRTHVIEAVRRARPDVEVVPFGVGLSLPRRVVLQQRKLGPLVDEARCDVALSTNTLLERCLTPQIVHHQNLLLFLPLIRAARCGPKNLMSAWLAKRALARSAANVFISAHMREEAERIFPGGRDRNVVIYNGLDADTIDGAGQPSIWDGRPSLLAVTGGLPHKDNATLIRALSELVSRYPRLPWKLDVAYTGELGAERALAETLGVADRVRWLGLVDNESLEKLYRASMCLIFTSKVEGFGMPVIEAMARSCPVVACRATAIPEVAGDAALLVEPSDAVAFANAANRLLTSAETRDRLVRRGAERARRFRWERSARRMLELIEGLA